MKPSERHSDEQGMKLKHDAELRSIAVLRHAEFVTEVVSSARAELSRRHLPVPTPGEYWRDLPQEWLAVIGFCYPCWAQSSDESAGTTSTERSFGVVLSGEVEPCATCGSVIKTKALWLGVPLIPLSQYRVILSAGGKYSGRRLKA